MRGYGQIGRPEAIDQYTLLHLVDNMVGLLDAVDVEQAVIAGHDWGAPGGVARHAAPLSRRDRDRRAVSAARTGAALLPDARRRRGGVRARCAPDPWHDPFTGSRGMFRGARVTATPRRRSTWCPGRADSPPGEPAAPTRMFCRGRSQFLCGRIRPHRVSRGLNWYCNIDRNWEFLAASAGARVTVSALYVAGDRDPVCPFRQGTGDPQLSDLRAQLRGTITLPGCGHWSGRNAPRRSTSR
jgi:pimeloyl-ACP methyl ester carboxylesterase